jgi:hypothetical protein
MIVMPANSTGWIWHSLARETGRLGHLFSPGAQRGPWPWFPYALDNGVFSMWNPIDNSFDAERWAASGEAAWRRLLFWAEAAPQRPLWAIVPDRPGSRDETLDKWEQYAPSVALRSSCKLGIAVQDGMTPGDIRSLYIKPDVVCVGGTTDWKWSTVEMWASEFPRVHVLRCNSPEKLYELEALGVESCDGTGWNRGDRKQTKGLEEWARSKAKPVTFPLHPHASRAQAGRQLSFA